MQLKFDMDVMEYLVSSNLAFNHVNTAGFQTFVRKLDPKLHVKDKSTFSRAKLPLLFRNVQKAVTKMLNKDLENSTGVCFTTDIWSSR